MSLVAVFIIIIFVYGILSKKIDSIGLTAPIIFTVGGVFTVFLNPDAAHPDGTIEQFLFLSEMGLVLLLFAEACKTDLKLLKSTSSVPLRLLSIGMLGTIVLGAVTAKLIFPALSWWEAGILASILAPTDAGLGQVIVQSPRVPERIRNALNVEAGLNDGLAVPFLLFFMALAAGDHGGDHDASLMTFIVEQLGYGLVVGLVIGLLGGYLLGLANKNDWMSKEVRHLAIFALPLACIIFSHAVGASMFIAAFVAGLAVQPGYKDAGGHSVEFTEQWGFLLNILIFFLFGVLFAGSYQQITILAVVYAVLSLTVIRMLPVWLAFIKSGLESSKVVFMGWFGPRGLASIVLGLVFIEHQEFGTEHNIIQMAVVCTVLLSTILHGISAKPGISLLESKLKVKNEK